jgi:hypothetical protein
MHDGLGAPHDREGVASVRQVGLDIVGFAFLGPFEDRRRQVRRPHVVAGLLQRGHRGASDLAPRPRHKYSHRSSLSRS